MKFKRDVYIDEKLVKDCISIVEHDARAREIIVKTFLKEGEECPVLTEVEQICGIESLEDYILNKPAFKELVLLK